jgi:hypothetical protein
MRTLRKLLATTAMIAASWLYQTNLQATGICTTYFPYCQCEVQYNIIVVRECNVMGYSEMASGCNAACQAIPYPGFSGGYLYDYYQEPETLEDSGDCLCEA